MSLKIGWAEVDITPRKKVSLAGQFAERISEYVEKPLTATALAIESEDDQIILVSADLPNFAWNLVCGVREKLAERNLGIDLEKIVFSAIHSHTSYGYGAKRRAPGFGGWSNLLKGYLRDDQKYIEKANVSNNPDIATYEENYSLLLEKIPEVVEKAWLSRKTGSFSNAFGRAVVGLCRRTKYSDNTAQMWGDTNTAVFEALEGGNDSGIELLYMFDDNKKLTGVVANLACPAQCVQHRLFVSPDFWGEVKVRIRDYFGKDVFLLPLCSAAGDQCPVDLIRWVEPESDLNDPNLTRHNPPKRKADPSMFDIVGMKKTGKRIANEIIDVWEEGLDDQQEDAVLSHRVINMELPIRRVTLTDVEHAKQKIREYLATKTEVDYNDAAHLQIYMGTIKRFEMQDRVDILNTEIHVARLGTIVIATNPFELFLDYGNQLKARSDAEQTFVVQLANGAEGYLPTKEAEIHGHYSAFVSSGQVGHEGGAQLVRETLQNIRELFEEN